VTCGCADEDFLEVAEALCENSGRERTSAFVYSAGRSTRSASSTSAPQRSSSSCSGTSGRQGGGILALRGHGSIQGSTDIPTLYDILPGYPTMPHSGRRPLSSSRAGSHVTGCYLAVSRSRSRRASRSPGAADD
jgi:formate dehydrogenase major subunit